MQQIQVITARKTPSTLDGEHLATKVQVLDESIRDMRRRIDETYASSHAAVMHEDESMSLIGIWRNRPCGYARWKQESLVSLDYDPTRIARLTVTTPAARAEEGFQDALYFEMLVVRE